MSILVTGNLGYVGDVLTRLLITEKFDVIGYDTGFFNQKFLGLNEPKIKQIKKDIRNITKEDLKDVSAICHLAALSNDPLGEINPNLTDEINFLSTVKLAKLAKEVGVEKFIFSSSCSSYGINEKIVNEESKLSPLTAYAKSKVNSERKLLELSDENFCTTNLRSATAYGLSNNLRLDLVVNNLTCSAFTTKKVKLLSDGTAWRPLVHVEDMSNAFITILKAKNSEVNGHAFNVGTNDDNYTVREIAEIVEKIIPDSQITYAEDASKDNRSYKVDFTKIKQDLGYKTKWDLEKTILGFYDLLKAKSFDEKDFKNEIFYRVSYIRQLIENKKIDTDLFFK
jgi:nucleoside-diphosphate-sugar epimerase